MLDKLTAKLGTALVIVDQPASIGALPLTAARHTDCKVAYLPGLAMRRIADLYPGEAKTDTKDTAAITDAARTMPHTLHSLELTNVVPGTGTLDIVTPSLARSPAAVHQQRRTLETQIDELLEAHPLSQVLTSLRG